MEKLGTSNENHLEQKSPKKSKSSTSPLSQSETLKNDFVDQKGRKHSDMCLRSSPPKTSSSSKVNISGFGFFF
jgi:hypothetical protein